MRSKQPSWTRLFRNRSYTEISDKKLVVLVKEGDLTAWYYLFKRLGIDSGLYVEGTFTLKEDRRRTYECTERIGYDD